MLLINIYSNDYNSDIITKNSSTSFLLSTGYYQYKDHLMNTLRNQGVGYVLGAQHSRLTENYMNNFYMAFNFTPLKNRYNMESKLGIVRLRYYLLRKNRPLLYGLNVNYTSLLYDNAYFDGQHNYWSTHFSFGSTLAYTYRVNSKNSIAVNVSLPLIGFISRPDSDRSLILNEPSRKISDVVKRINSNCKFVFLSTKFIYTDIGVYYQFILKNMNILALGYTIRYEHTHMPDISRLFTNELTIFYQITKNKND